MQVSNDFDKTGVFLQVGGRSVLNGIMNGEVVEEWEKKGESIQAFEIRL